jgi:hypothetical protein
VHEVTARGRKVVWVAGLILVATIGILGILHATAFDPATVKAELERKIEELNRIPAEEAIRKDTFAEELLANASYKEHARALYLKVERAHPRLHDASQLEREALKIVPSFLARCRDLSRLAPADLDLLLDEARSHFNNFAATRYGSALRKAQEALKAKLESAPRSVTPPEVVELSRKVHQSVAEGHFSAAIDLIAELMKRPGALEFNPQIQPLRKTIAQKAAAAVEALLEKARGLMDRGDKALAAQLIDRSMPDFKGMKEAAVLDSYRRTIRLP